jgi:hypothetical protein
MANMAGRLLRGMGRSFSRTRTRQILIFAEWTEYTVADLSWMVVNSQKECERLCQNFAIQKAAALICPSRPVGLGLLPTVDASSFHLFADSGRSEADGDSP